MSCHCRFISILANSVSRAFNPSGDWSGIWKVTTMRLLIQNRDLFLALIAVLNSRTKITYQGIWKTKFANIIDLKKIVMIFSGGQANSCMPVLPATIRIQSSFTSSFESSYRRTTLQVSILSCSFHAKFNHVSTYSSKTSWTATSNQTRIKCAL